MMALSSVVLPTPLRPMTQVHDPSGTDTVVPRSVWLLP
jgi:hypothetical protein